MDISALRSLKNIHNICKKRGVTLVLSHVQEQPKNMMEKAGFAAEVGEENFCANIDAALAHAKELVGQDKCYGSKLYFGEGLEPMLVDMIGANWGQYGEYCKGAVALTNEFS